MEYCGGDIIKAKNRMHKTRAPEEIKTPAIQILKDRLDSKRQELSVSTETLHVALVDVYNLHLTLGFTLPKGFSVLLDGMELADQKKREAAAPEIEDDEEDEFDE